MYAIVDIAGQQFKVEKEQKIFVNRLNVDEGKKIEFDQVLLIDNDGKVNIGSPVISGASVSAQVLSHVRGDKVLVFKKKRRKGYQKLNGHRQDLSEILIEEINEKSTGKKTVKEEPAKETKTAKPEEAVKKEETKPAAAKKEAEPSEKKETKAETETKKADTAKKEEKPKAEKKEAPKAEAKKAEVKPEEKEPKEEKKAAAQTKAEKQSPEEKTKKEGEDKEDKKEE